MKYILLPLFSLLVLATFSQKPGFSVTNISLPPEISYYDNQFSGLYIHEGKLFLMSESRLKNNAEGKLYAIKLSDLDHKITDTAYVLPFQKYQLYNLDILRDKINAITGQQYEGLEAIIIDSNNIYLSVETSTPSSNCYLIRGRLNDTAVVLGTDFLVPMLKPTRMDGSPIYNAGFEAIMMIDNEIFAFFEYNFFDSYNYVYTPDIPSVEKKERPHFLPINKLPFRITDITPAGKDHFTAINYFFAGSGKDTVYRTPAGDIENNKLIKNSAGYHGYNRLIDIEFTGKEFKWKPLWEFPWQYTNYNWEGIAAYKIGYFIINDEYTPKPPPISTLLYIQKNN